MSRPLIHAFPLLRRHVCARSLPLGGAELVVLPASRAAVFGAVAHLEEEARNEVNQWEIW